MKSKTSPSVHEIDSLHKEIEADKREMARLEGVIQQLQGEQRSLEEMKKELETLVAKRARIEQQYQKALAAYQEEFGRL